jgi:hypothetical protein
MDYTRYSFDDEYIVAEAMHEYLECDHKGRLHLLRKLNRTQIPYAIAQLAATDSSVQVRSWLARKSKLLDYSGPIFEGGTNLEECLRSDSEQVVRASVFENPNVSFARSLFTDWESVFKDATNMERLALVRNPNVTH